MRKFFRTYTRFTIAAMQDAAIYRVNFLFSIVGSLFACFVAFFLWNAVFTSSEQDTFMGFTFATMVSYIFLSFFTGTATSSGSGWSMAHEIKSGDIAMKIIRPVNFKMAYLFEEIGSKLMNTQFIFLIALVGIEIFHYHAAGTIQFNLGFFAIYLISAMLALLISFYFDICFGFLAFIFKNIWGLQMMKDVVVGFLSGAMIPLVFLPDQMQNILTLLPFSSLIFTPVMIYLGMFNTSQILVALSLQVFWLGFFIILSELIWRSVIKRLSIQGG